MTNAVAIDFETTYTDTRDIKKLGSKAYLRHPETDIYLVSLVGEGVEWVGHPKDAPWHLLEGREWVSHNRSFDKQVWQELKHRGLSVSSPTRWHCTADMVACLQVKRDLATASKVLLGVHLDKGVRNRMKNQTWETMTPEFREEALAYAKDDAMACWCLWDQHNHKWPEKERLLSEHTTLMCNRGVRINLDLVRKDIEWLQYALALVLKFIPWAGEKDEDGEEVKIGSAPRLRKECVSIGIPEPESTNVKDERFGDWADEYADKALFVAAIQQWRQITRLLGFANSCLKRTMPDGRMSYGLKYCGAPHTRRWSGDEGLSVHNMPKGAYTAAELGSALWPGEMPDEITENLSLSGVDPESECNPRHYIVPENDHVFVSADLSQIEPRVLALLSGQGKLMELLRGGYEIYEAQARAMGMYSAPTPLKETDPELRQTVKILNLGLGYGLGGPGLARSYRRNLGKKLPASRANHLKDLYRSKNKAVTDLWKRLKGAADRASSTDKQVEVELPSGRSILYYDVRKDTTAGVVGFVERGGKIRKLWHGLLTENCTQGTARDALADMILDIEKSMPVILHVHDEVLTEVPSDRAEEALEQVKRVMSTSPEWAPQLPVACEAKLMERYEKK